jgi:hypothetical protein
MPNIQKAHVWTLVVAILSLFAIWILLFPIANFIAEYFAALVGVASLDEYVIVDTVVSFVILCAFFSVILLVKTTDARFVVSFCAVSMFLYWGFESEFFWKGLNPMYPAWYEINMAFNDLIAAALTIFVQSRITRRSIGRVLKAVHAG